MQGEGGRSLAAGRMKQMCCVCKVFLFCVQLSGPFTQIWDSLPFIKESLNIRKRVSELKCAAPKLEGMPSSSGSETFYMFRT